MRELFPILVTLAILAAIFGLWYSARNNGWFVDKRADDFSICRTSPDTLSFLWKYPNLAYRDGALPGTVTIFYIFHLICLKRVAEIR